LSGSRFRREVEKPAAMPGDLFRVLVLGARLMKRFLLSAIAAAFLFAPIVQSAHARAIDASTLLYWMENYQAITEMRLVTAGEKYMTEQSDGA
jgi:hypothetical protein